MNKYNYWAPWHKLKTTILGKFYSPEFFENVENDLIRSNLQRIAEETEEDLLNYKSVLESAGVRVIRPYLDPNDRIERYLQDGMVNNINPFGRVRTVPRAPLQPRDFALVINGKLHITHGDHAALFDLVDEYNKEDQVVLDWELDSFSEEKKNKLYRQYYNTRKTKDWPSFEDIHTADISKKDPMTQMEVEYFRKYARQSMVHMIKAPCISIVGKDMIVEGALFDQDKFQEIDWGYEPRYNLINIGGHADGCYRPIKKGVIISIFPPSKYVGTYPGWDVCELFNTGKHTDIIKQFYKWRGAIGGRWYVDGEINKQFIDYVDNYLSEFVGFTVETDFDVNCMSLDGDNILVSGLTDKAKNFFKKHKIEPTLVPFRHRHFHDGGLHCVTLDLYREGEMEDYWPHPAKEHLIGSDGTVRLNSGNKYRRRGFGDQTTLNETLDEYNYRNEEAREKFELEKELRKIEKDGGGETLHARGQWWSI